MTILALAFAWNVSPLAWSLSKNGGDVTAQAKTWSPAISFLKAHLGAVVPRRGGRHGDALGGGVSRGRAASRSHAAGTGRTTSPRTRCSTTQLGPKAYLAWLRGLGVRYVVLPHATLDYSSRGEAALVRSGRSGLVRVFHTPESDDLPVPNPQSIITGPGSPVLTSVTQSRIGAEVRRGGTYRIAVRWSPYWHASLGCLSEGKDKMIRLTTRRAHFVRLTFRVNAARALDEIVGQQPTLQAAARRSGRPRRTACASRAPTTLPRCARSGRAASPDSRTSARLPTGAPTMRSAASASLMPFGHEPTPSFHAASIMFWAARPLSNWNAEPAIATTSVAPRTLPGA